MRLGPVVFEPWAEVLLDAVRVSPGDDVLDVASGTGVVARAAAGRAGPEGRVVGTDVSEPMLSLAAARPLPDGSAPIEYLEARADRLPFPDDSFDAVLCQQGLQFFGERLEAAREMHRVARPGGTVGAAVWAAGYRLEPFDDYAEALAATGVEPPFPRAFDNSAFVMSDGAARKLFEDAGFEAVDVSVVERTVAFPDPGAAADGILGTPFGPVVAALPGEQSESLRADLLRRFHPESPREPVRRTTAAVIVRATK
ncbi:MAG TPA: class I SAM-dependent methyltransferase [Solirubrobacteraceae bacterium]|nr:class I SAM-dependent methyltransferase [Solirubrobacteraceae bacterium]